MNGNENRSGLVVLAVDDEFPALSELAYLLGQDPRVGRVLTASDSDGALRILCGSDTSAPLRPADPAAASPGKPPLIKQSGIDVLFLDIRMPGLDGLDLANRLAEHVIPPAVVFVTAHDDRAIEAFDVGAVDYLLKPLRQERLTACLTRILASRAAVPVAGPGRDDGEDEVIPVELAGTTKLVQRSSVRWVEAQGDYARLHTDEGSHLVRIPLSVLEERWADAGFVRIHRSYLVALPLVTELRLAGSGYVVRLGSAGEIAELPVSRRHTRELKDRLVRATKHAWSQR